MSARRPPQDRLPRLIAPPLQPDMTFDDEVASVFAVAFEPALVRTPRARRA